MLYFYSPSQTILPRHSQRDKMKNYVLLVMFTVLLAGLGMNMVSASNPTTTPLIHVMYQIHNDSDSGYNTLPYWALDNYTQTLTVWNGIIPGTYQVNVTDNGTSCTFAGARSPNAGIPQITNGCVTMTGGYDGNLTTSAPLINSSATTIGNNGILLFGGTENGIINGEKTDTLDAYNTWIQYFFPGTSDWTSSFAFSNNGNDWGWTYTDPSNSLNTWTDAGTVPQVSSGDIIIQFKPKVVLSVTANVINDEDSGYNTPGYWALDNFTRNITVWQTGPHSYSINFTDHGFSSIPAGVQSPGIMDATEPYNGIAVMNGVDDWALNGTFTGTSSYSGNGLTVPSSLTTNANVGTYDSGATVADLLNNPQIVTGDSTDGFQQFAESFFSGITNDQYGTSNQFYYYSYVYDGSLGKQVWVDAANVPSTNSGDIVTNKLVLFVTANLTNDVDSGYAGNWANDNFSRTMKIYQTGVNSFVAYLNDSGNSYITAGSPSPNAGTTQLFNGVTKMTGNQNVTFDATSFSTGNLINSIDNSSIGTYNMNGNSGEEYYFTYGLTPYFTGVSNVNPGANGYTYTYVYNSLLGKQTWVDSSNVLRANSGDIVTNKLIIDATYQVHNDSDSGWTGGTGKYWALDNYTQKLLIWQVATDRYQVNVTDNGTSCTFAGASSPNSGNAQIANGCVSMFGGYDGNLTTSVTPVNTIQSTLGSGTLLFGGTENAIINGQSTDTVDPYNSWIQYFFPGTSDWSSSFAFANSGNDWGWTYTDHSNGDVWIDAGTVGNGSGGGASSGDIIFGSVNGTTETASSGSVVLSSTSTGQAGLPSGTSNLALNNNSTLDLSGSVQTASGGSIVINGSSTSLSSVTINSGSVDLSVPQNIGGQSVQITQAVQLTSGVASTPVNITNSALPGVSVSIPDGATIFAPSGWNGTLTPPTNGSSSGTAPSGFSVGSTVIEVGAPGVELILSQPATLVLPGVTGAVGYEPSGSSTWVHITDVCGGTYASPAPPVFPGACYISNGVDTEIVTYHFTTFGSLNVYVAPSHNGGGGSGGGVGSGGGGGPQSPTITKTSNGYDVTGLTQFNTFNITMGSLIQGTENYITPSTAGITLNGTSYALSLNSPVQIGSNATATRFVQLTNISYVPLQQTVNLQFYAVFGPAPLVAPNSTTNNSSSNNGNSGATTTIPVVANNTSGNNQSSGTVLTYLSPSGSGISMLDMEAGVAAVVVIIIAAVAYAKFRPAKVAAKK